MLEIGLIVLGLVIGGGVGYVVRQQIAAKSIGSAEQRAQDLINEAKSQEKDLLLKAKDKALELIEEAKKEEQSRREDLKQMQRRLEKRESLFDKKLIDIENKQQKLQDRAEEIKVVKEKVDKLYQEQVDKLQHVAQMTKDQAQDLLFQRVEKDVQDSLVSRIGKLQKQASADLERKAQDLLATIIHRTATKCVYENMTSLVDLPSDEMKGRIIGREGRNIKSFEQLTGVEVIVDDTPQAITLSCFSPVRRAVAKIALEKLVLDGRIHPARIEETILEAKKELAVEMTKLGEEAVYELGIVGFEPKLIQIIGRLKYRTSYGQNILAHSIEVAHIAGMLASHLGANVDLAKKGGLLHDVGKAFDHDIQGTHPEIGREIAKKFNLHDTVVKAIAEHHDDQPSTLEGIIVKVADAISGARPGARSQTEEKFLQRLQDLENLAQSYKGVEKAYAIHAGREVRVFVTPDDVDDLQAQKMAQDIAQQIESELRYPGEIKVNVIRESRVSEYAR